MNQHNSDYEDAGAKAITDPERDLDGNRIEWADAVWLGDLAGWQACGDEDCGVSIRCPRCYDRDMDTPWILVPADSFPWLANVVMAALGHECPGADNA